MKKLLIALFLSTIAHAQSVQQSIDQLGQSNNWVLAFRWTASAAGVVPSTPSKLGNCCQGYLITQVETVPGTPSPTAGYSVAITDAGGVDVLAGAAASLSSTTGQSFAAADSATPVQGSFNLVITGQSGASAQGVVYVFLSKPGTINTAKLAGSGIGSSPNWLTIANAPFMDTRRYNFTPQSPGGNLAAGSNTINLTAGVYGLNGTDSGHYLYVSGGTGTPEACLVTGGTALSNVKGTIVMTCANSHSGAWTIRSATNGGQEAVQILTTAGTGGNVVYPPGVLANCGTLTVTSDGIVISGAGSGGTGLAYPSTAGTAGTQIQPCFANQTLFSAPSGHIYFSTLNQLSMHDMGFSNAGLAGITAISIVHDVGGIFTNLAFYGTTNAFTGISVDRVWGADFTNIHSYGTEGSFFGSTVDTDVSPNWPYSTVHILNWDYVGAGAVKTAMTLQRCVSCSLAHSRFQDTALAVSGTAVVISNDSQGSELDDVVTEGFFYGLRILQSTVGATTAAPGWTTVSSSQFDCAGGANCLNNAFVMIGVGAGSYYTSILNPTLSAVTTAGVGIQIAANAISTPVANINGGLFSLTQGTQINILSTATGISIHGADFNGASPGAAILLSGGGAVSDLMLTGNHFSSTGPAVSAAGGTTLTASLFSGNSCASPSGSGTCNAMLVNQITACSGVLTGTTVWVLDSSTTTWGATITGGSSSSVGAACNGTNWTVAAK